MKQIILSEKNETLGNFLVQNKDVVYSALLDSIEKHYLDLNKNNVDVLKIRARDKTTHITLLRKDWARGLKKAIKYFEKPNIEQYEKCKRCLDIINFLEKK
tara:strand:- start:9920 stop:10222 length:303 start_codon:yes stop_codon:yes gene_type:complete